MPGGPGGNNGLTAEYSDDRGPVVTEIDPTPTSSMVAPSALEAGQRDSVTWSGYITVPSTGTYQFIIDLGQGVVQSTRVTIAGEQVYTNSTTGLTGYPPEITQSSISLTGGVTYPIVIFCGNMYNFNWAPRAIIINSSGQQTALTSTYFAPAVITSQPQFNTSLTVPNQVNGTWSASDSPVGFRVYRQLPNTPTWEFFTLGLYGSYSPSQSSFVDTSVPEGTDVRYYIKSVYNNPVTGATTLSTGTESDIVVPWQIALSPANTGDGRITLFWSAPPDCSSFNIYQDSAEGSPSNLVGNVSPSSVQDTRYGQTNSYMYSLSGLTFGTTYYFTVQGLDANGNVVHTSQQEMCDADTTGIPWDEANTSDLEAQILADAGYGPNSGVYYYMLGPNNVLYSYENGDVSAIPNDYTSTADPSFLTGPHGEVKLKPWGNTGPYFEWYTKNTGYNFWTAPISLSSSRSDYNLLSPSGIGFDTANVYTGGGLLINGKTEAPVDAGLESYQTSSGGTGHFEDALLRRKEVPV